MDLEGSVAGAGTRVGVGDGGRESCSVTSSVISRYTGLKWSSETLSLLPVSSKV